MCFCVREVGDEDKELVSEDILWGAGDKEEHESFVSALNYWGWLSMEGSGPDGGT